VAAKAQAAQTFKHPTPGRGDGGNPDRPTARLDNKRECVYWDVDNISLLFLGGLPPIVASRVWFHIRYLLQEVALAPPAKCWSHYSFC
jgi:hypothetical protein